MRPASLVLTFALLLAATAPVSADVKELATLDRRGEVHSRRAPPEGKMRAGGGQERTEGQNVGFINLWARENRKLKTILRGHAGMVTALAFSPNGKKLYSGGVDATVRVWDVETAK